MGIPVIVSLSVLVPALNEEKTVSEVVRSHKDFLRSIAGLDFEIVVLDDGSSDRTGEILNSQFSDDPYVRVISNEMASGISGAFAKLADAAAKEWLYFTSADGQFPVECLSKMLGSADVGDELIVGNRSGRFEVYSLSRRLVSGGYRIIGKALFGIDPVDPGSVKLVRRERYLRGFRSRSVARDLELIVMVNNSGARVRFVDIPFEPRRSGKSSGNAFKEISDALWDVLLLRWRLSRE